MSDTLVQVIFGVGLPCTAHARVTNSLSFTVLLLEMLITVGASAQEINKIRVISEKLILVQIILVNVHLSKVLFGGDL